MVRNLGLIFKAIPQGFPKPGQDLAIEDHPILLDTALPDGGLLTKNVYLSFDPFQRGRMRAAEVKSYAPPYGIGETIYNSGISQVIKTANDKFEEGDLVAIWMRCPTEEYSVLTKEIVEKAVQKLDNPLALDPKVFLGPLGMPGLTAYGSFYEIGSPKKGETIFISAASGAVGQVVGQLAKHEGLRVVGSVGDDAKLDFIKKDLGFDEGFNYKKEKPGSALKRLAPDGIDIYYDNVGGEHLEAALDAMKDYGRIIVCGMVSQYNLAPEDMYPIRNLQHVNRKRIKMQGFIQSDSDIGPKYHDEHQENIQKWIKDGSFKAQLSVTEGIENAAEGLVGMLQGKNFGKAVLKIAELEMPQ